MYFRRREERMLRNKTWRVWEEPDSEDWRKMTLGGARRGKGWPSDTSEQGEMTFKIYNNQGGMGIKTFKRAQWP